MFLQVFVLCLIHSVTSISNQEDLAIPPYAHVGCLLLKPDHQFLVNSIQENALLPYQSYSGFNLPVDLCFRLCRRWVILMNLNHTNCICLYTINELYEMNEHLGEILSPTKCSTYSLHIYSFTDDAHLFPSPTPNEDWSFDGCYHLHGIQTYHANFQLNQMNYTQAMDSCRKQCQTLRSPTYFAYFLSMKKFCYCLPIKLSPSITTIGVRKPIIHCSFLPYIQQKLNSSFNSSEINPDTVVKINVQRFCSSSFIFDRNLYLCLNIVLLSASTSYPKILTSEGCSSVLIKTIDQWTHLLSLLPTSRMRTFVPIDRNSTYLVEDLFQEKVRRFSTANLCVIINRTRSITFDLIPCSTIQSPGYIFCSQKPFESINYNQSEFQSIKPIAMIDNITCPSDFVLFNNLCYYVDTSFAYSIQHGRQVCADRFINASLVQFQSQQWGNVNSTRFLGRALDDTLLELFYYQLEQKLLTEDRNETKSKHWLRLLIGEKSNENECILRYFIRSSGAFTILHQCNQGGHPVCQTQPIAIIETSTTTTTTTTVRSTFVPQYEKADEDLVNNETEIESTIDLPNSTFIQTIIPRSNHRAWLRILILSFLACLSIVLILISLIVIRHLRRSHGSYSTYQTNNSSSSKSPAVLYSRLNSLPPSIIIDTDMTHDDNIHLLSSSTDRTTAPQFMNKVAQEVEEEPLYATLKVPIEK